MEFMEYITTPKLDGVTLYQANQAPIEGTLCITAHHLILSSRQDFSEELWLLHSSVDSVEKRLNGSESIITLKCKDFQILKLGIPSADDCVNIAYSIEALSNIADICLSYPFYNRVPIEMLEDGWHAYTVETEFSRIQNFVAYEWRLSYVNKNYKVCSSYPECVVVLKSVDDETLIKSASFRQNGRFPVLSYYHKPNKMVLMRCSQPLTGPNNRRCREDEVVVNSVLTTSSRIRGYIVDTRSITSTKMAAARGGGVEPEAYYPQWRRVNQPIERPSNLQDSLTRLIEACLDVGASMDKWLSKLDSSNWLGHVKDALTCACTVAQYMENGGSVLVHGGEGTDTTLVVTSLTQLILNPDCRTVVGFEALLAREWIQAGHPFSSRCCKSAFATSKNKQEAPMFLLFLDCVWQIWQQFSCSFEFNEQFLIILFKHAYASQFGTFLFNNEQERSENKLSEKTISLWSYLNCPKILCQYMNPLYEPNQSVLWPSVLPHSLQLWTSVYQCWQRFLPIQTEIWDEIVQIKQDNKEIRATVVKMKKYLVKLEKEALNRGLVDVSSE
ncbi:hypothetical protein HELRODRAFT_108507 [Helobdella robusta]|uniref:Myotubularin phosphatase domain-containing protein n=1 Tax=Helobdella robusta TaxID=6412 RepID=T1EEJ6_HELRO|nr:hypothetical protein HELRODRAFT_108507 [Helobdella robusta]ESN91759.1 hypothetical protein HELRODRAFT_108507 [Helobdella robusta]